MPLDSNLPETTSLIRTVCRKRDAALARMEEAASTLDNAYVMAREASAFAREAHQGAKFYHCDRTTGDDYKALFGADFDREKSLTLYRKQLDASIWTYLIERCGIHQLMDKTARDEFRTSLLQDVPEISEETVSATIKQLYIDRDLIFMRGLAKAFSDLDRRFKSHDGFKVGARIVLTYMFDEHGSWSYHSNARDTLIDIERVLATLDELSPNADGLISQIQRSRGSSFAPRQSETVTPYMRIKGYKNGNAHLWFTRDDLVRKVNQILAEYYGDVIGDAMTKDATAEDLKHRPGVPAVRLQFYPTPPAVVARMLSDLYIKPGDRILEPSAGTGNIATALAKKGAKVYAVEIHPERAETIARLDNPNITAICANFLGLPAEPAYDAVVMNPPFYGTHWMDHIRHAFDFLKPGGKLVAVLPVTAELGETKRHQEFRKWAMGHSDRWTGLYFQDLPAESFAESGTRINTVMLTLRK